MTTWAKPNILDHYFLTIGLSQSISILFLAFLFWFGPTSQWVPIVRVEPIYFILFYFTYFPTCEVYFPTFNNKLQNRKYMKLKNFLITVIMNVCYNISGLNLHHGNLQHSNIRLKRNKQSAQYPSIEGTDFARNLQVSSCCCTIQGLLLLHRPRNFAQN
jgi:hypothetical protein